MTSPCLGEAKSNLTESTSTVHLARGNFTTASFPLSAAHDSGVRPEEFFESTSTLPLLSSNFTAISNPLSAAPESVISASTKQLKGLNFSLPQQKTPWQSVRSKQLYLILTRPRCLSISISISTTTNRQNTCSFYSEPNHYYEINAFKKNIYYDACDL